MTERGETKYFDAAGAEEAALRAAVDAFAERLGRLPGEAELHSAWAMLLKQLSLPEPQRVRTCPSCGGISMRAATRCGHCWVHLTPEP